MGAVGSVGPAGVTLQFALARRGHGSCATVQELNLAHRRRRAPWLLGAGFRGSPPRTRCEAPAEVGVPLARGTSAFGGCFSFLSRAQAFRHPAMSRPVPLSEDSCQQLRFVEGWSVLAPNVFKPVV